nr:hypothetical protein [uncultured Duganella sp.]
MEVKAQATVRGAKMFKGSMDDGKAIDSGKLFVEVILKESDNAFGMCTEPMKCKNSSVVESIKHVTFPFIAELTIDMVSGSKGLEQVVTSVHPVQAIKTSVPAAKA